MRRKLSFFALTCAVAAPLLAAAPVAAPNPIKVRHDGYHSLGSAFKNVRDQLGSNTPNGFILKLSAKQIRDAAAAQYGWFPAGSGPREGVKTAARAEIWSQAVAFKKAQDAFNIQAQAFAKVAATGEIAKMKLLVKPLGQTCATCHKSFRVEQH